MENNFTVIIQLYSKLKFIIPILWMISFFLLLCVNKPLQKYNSNKELFRVPVLKIEKKDLILLLIISAAVLFWKSSHLGYEDLDIQESTNIFSAQEIRTNAGGVINSLLIFAHQPLYPLIYSLFTKWFDLGSCVYIVRFISVIFSLLTAWLAYVFSLKILKDRAASFVAFIAVNTSGLLSMYSRRVEVYSIFCFFSLLSFYYFWNVFISREEKRLWKYWAATCACFFLHYLAVVVVFAQLLVILFLTLKKRGNAGQFLGFLKVLILFSFPFIAFIPPLCVSFLKKPLFENAYDNLFFLAPKYLGSLCEETIRLTLGLPPCSFYIFLLLMVLYIFVLFKLSKNNFVFFILINSIGIALLSYGFFFHLCGLNIMRGIFFNIRHFILFVPFAAMILGYGCVLIRKEQNVLMKITLTAFLLWLLCWNVYLTQKINFKPTSPSYRQALHYIRDRFNEKTDIVAYPSAWLIRLFDLYRSDIFAPGKGENKFENFSPEQILKNKDSFKRIWVIIPREYIFSIPHLNSETLDSYINFLKQNFRLKSSWQGKQIFVYLFTVR